MMCRRQWLATVVALAMLAVPCRAAQLSGKILRVGFPGSGQDAGSSGSDFYRPGCWTPVQVELTNTDGDLFQGTLEVTQPDRDGDEVISRPSTSVSVRGSRTYYLYIPAAGRQRDTTFTVRVFDADGQLVTLSDDAGQKVTALQPTRPLVPIQPAGACVVMDISEAPITQLTRLLRDEPRPLIRSLYVTRVAPSTLPDSVAGLEMVDTIVWDNPDPSLIDPAQLGALIDWTRRGGTLLVGVSRKWELLARSRLGPLLPARLTGTRTVESAPELADALFNALRMDFDRPLEVAAITPDALAEDTVLLLPAAPGPKEQMYVTQRACGRGRIVMCSAVLQDLLARGTSNDAFLYQLLGLRRLERSEIRQNAMPRDLFPFLEALTGFRLATGLYFLFAFLFVVGYILVATAGSWAWLKRRNRLTWSWPAFGVLALAASAASLAAVQVIRGTGNDVEQLTVVDARAGSPDAAAICYLGMKTATHTELDLALPSDWRNPDEPQELAAGLAPLPPNPEAYDLATYVAGQRYEIVPSVGQLRSVPFRATLKQLQGFWEGQLGGRLDAALKRRPDTPFRLTADSWIKNELDTDLQNCHLFVAIRNSADARADRSNFIYVYDLGTMRAGERLNWGEYLARKNAGSTLPDADYMPPVLRTIQGTWIQALGLRYMDFGMMRNPGMRDEEREVRKELVVPATLLLSVLSELDQNELLQQQLDLTHSRGRELDCSSSITQRTALLIGLSETSPGPARLCWRKPGRTGGWRAIEPADSRVIYRFLIPVAGQPQRTTEEAELEIK